MLSPRQASDSYRALEVSKRGEHVLAFSDLLGVKSLVHRVLQISIPQDQILGETRWKHCSSLPLTHTLHLKAERPARTGLLVALILPWRWDRAFVCLLACFNFMDVETEVRGSWMTCPCLTANGRAGTQTQHSPHQGLLPPWPHCLE